jgi:hypothetical protein
MAVLDHRSCGLRGKAWKRVDVGGVDLAEGFDHHVAVLSLPVIILPEQNGTDQAQDQLLVGEDADHISATLHLFVQTFQWVGAVKLGAMLGRKGHLRQ